ncbi:MAG: hypothetical protein V1876_00225, partial [Candidatus Peregrinibacteria bacterium]
REIMGNTRPHRAHQHAVSSVALCCAFAFLLSACAPIRRQQARARIWWGSIVGTASGTVTTVRGTAKDTVEVGKKVIDSASGAVRQVGETLQEFEDRVEKVKKGVENIQQGRKMIEESIRNGE